MTSANTLDRNALRRAVAVANGKGGVGKTSVSSHLSAMGAASGRRVLLVDLDPQGNAADDLGYDNDDNGAGLVRAVMARTELHIIRDVRPGLDVVPGGVELNELADHLHSKRLRAGTDGALAGLAAALAPVAGEYDLVVYDCPPANSDVLQDAALVAARYLLIPTHSDRSSRKGIIEMARRFVSVKSTMNADLALLGVILFGINHSATQVQRTARTWVAEALAGQAPVFDTTIRHVEAAALDIREEGRLAHELAQSAAPGTAGRALGLAKDYHRMAAEVFTRLAALETAAAV